MRRMWLEAWTAPSEPDDEQVPPKGALEAAASASLSGLRLKHGRMGARAFCKVSWHLLSACHLVKSCFSQP